VIRQTIRRALRAYLLARAPSRRGRGLAAAVVGAATGILLILATQPTRADPPIAAPTCSLRLSLEVTPDVPDPTDAGFLSSLLGNHLGYQLYLLGKVDDTHVNLQLQGPGPGERCREVIDAMRNDGRVASIDVS
jgi:hypothetical protein